VLGLMITLFVLLRGAMRSRLASPFSLETAAQLRSKQAA
jgi:hypothetical protein